jgi:hypothetical protein
LGFFSTFWPVDLVQMAKLLDFDFPPACTCLTQRMSFSGMVFSF